MRYTTPLITIVLRSYGRPFRTQRMLECLNKQTINNIELIFFGDECKTFDAIVKSDWFDNWKADFKRKGNELFFMNNAIGGRDWGAKITNQAIQIARGHYFCFADNDDMLKPEHMEYYYKSIIREKADFVYNPVLVNGPDGMWRRVLDLHPGAVGHSELVIKTEFLKKMPKHQPVYGQDWILVENMMSATDKYLKGDPAFPTYCIMSTEKYPEPGMENDK